jgi:hypothetical protein
MMRLVLLSVCLLLLASPALAIEEQVYSQETFTKTFILSNIPDYVKTPEGGIGWDLFGTTKEIAYDEKDGEGMDIMGVKPEFAAALKKLAGQRITMQGYMFPLEQSDRQRRFLFGPFPMTCPFHYHVGPSLVIEADARDPIDFTYDPITITGRLELVPLDIENNIFYYLHDVTMNQ